MLIISDFPQEDIPKFSNFTIFGSQPNKAHGIENYHVPLIVFSRSFQDVDLTPHYDVRNCIKLERDFQGINSTKFAGNSPYFPSGPYPFHQPTSICSICVMVSPGSKVISFWSSK